MHFKLGGKTYFPWHLRKRICVKGSCTENVLKCSVICIYVPFVKYSSSVSSVGWSKAQVPCFSHSWRQKENSPVLAWTLVHRDSYSGISYFSHALYLRMYEVNVLRRLDSIPGQARLIWSCWRRICCSSCSRKDRWRPPGSARCRGRSKHGVLVNEGIILSDCWFICAVKSYVRIKCCAFI